MIKATKSVSYDYPTTSIRFLLEELPKMKYVIITPKGKVPFTYKINGRRYYSQEGPIRFHFRNWYEYSYLNTIHTGCIQIDMCAELSKRNCEVLFSFFS